MKNCFECGKKVGLLSGYKHPTKGHKHPVCGHCFDRIDESVKAWGNFIEEYSLVPSTEIDLTIVNPMADILKVPAMMLISKVN